MKVGEIGICFTRKAKSVKMALLLDKMSISRLMDLLEFCNLLCSTLYRWWVCMDYLASLCNMSVVASKKMAHKGKSTIRRYNLV